MAQERVQKILAQAGIASRRKAEELIEMGLVTVNGKVAKLGDKAEMGKDAIKVEGKLITRTEAPIYLAFNKPKNVISALSDPEGRPCLGDYLSKVHTRVYPIGRLDFTSEGLILLTNDGAFAQSVQKRDDIPRVYHVKIKGHPETTVLKSLERGGRIDGKLVRPHSVKMVDEYASKSRIELVMLGSGAMDIKTFLEHRGVLVDRMIRTSIGHITLHDIKPGHFKLLRKSQAEALLTQPELFFRDRAFEEKKEKEKEARRPAPRLPEPRETPLPKWRRSESSRSAPSSERRGTPFAEGGRTRPPRDKRRWGAVMPSPDAPRPGSRDRKPRGRR